MNLRILLPSQVFAEVSEVSRVVVETTRGSYGLLPNRLDCVAALVPGILTYQVAGAPEVYVAVDEGVLVKTGAELRVSVRRALSGVDLAELRDAVLRQFLALDAQEQSARQVLAKLEVGFLRRFAALQHE